MIFFGKWSSLGCLDNDLAKSWVQLSLLITQGINMLLKDIFKCLTLFIKLRFLWIGICCREITMKSVEVWFNSLGSNKIWFAAKLLSIWYTLYINWVLRFTVCIRFVCLICSAYWELYFIVRDLHPKNVLLDEEGHILLTYFGSWEETEHIPDEEAMNHFYCAPGNIW